MEVNKTNWRRHDFRAKSLYMVVEGLAKSIAELEKNVEAIHWYDGDWLMEETEPIYGLAFIAFQNYINGSISDFDGDIKQKNTFYKKAPLIENSNRTNIELIITLANYAKHKDEGDPHPGTSTVLDAFDFKYKNLIYLDEGPIFRGLAILNADYDLFKIMETVISWREHLWLPAP